MRSAQWAPSHRQLVSAIIALTLPADPDNPPILARLGYALIAIELPMVDQSAHQYQLDLLLLRASLNLSLLIECKSGPDPLGAEQVNCYMNTTGTEVIVASGITVQRPEEHLANPVFFIVPGAEPTLVQHIAACPRIASAGWGMVRIEPQRFVLAHDELTDTELSASLTAGWDIDLQKYPSKDCFTIQTHLGGN